MFVLRFLILIWSLFEFNLFFKITRSDKESNKQSLAWFGVYLPNKKIYNHIFIYKEKTSEVIQNESLRLWIGRTQL